jgi:hypothetical protein
MKVTASILLIFFSFLTVEPLVSWAKPAEKQETCMKSCCSHHANKEKKTPKSPMKGMCGEMSCNPFGQYSCCTGFVVSNKTIFSFVPEKLWEKKTLFTQPYTSNFACDCWRPPENTVTTLG